MLRVREALKELDGLEFDPVELRRAFENVFANNLKEIAPEFTLRDLYELARDERLITELQAGTSVKIKINFK